MAKYNKKERGEINDPDPCPLDGGKIEINEEICEDESEKEFIMYWLSCTNPNCIYETLEQLDLKELIKKHNKRWKPIEEKSKTP